MNEFEVEVVQKTSKKGAPYYVLEVYFPNGYKKIVFLEQAEQYLAKSCLDFPAMPK